MHIYAYIYIYMYIYPHIYVSVCDVFVTQFVDIFLQFFNLKIISVCIELPYSHKWLHDKPFYGWYAIIYSTSLYWF